MGSISISFLFPAPALVAPVIIVVGAAQPASLPFAAVAVWEPVPV